jgi:hypothetical protein
MRGGDPEKEADMGLDECRRCGAAVLSAEKHDHWRRRSRSEWTVLSARSMIGRIGPTERRSVSGIRFSEPFGTRLGDP